MIHVNPENIAKQTSAPSSDYYRIHLVYGDEARLVLREALLPLYTTKQLYDVVQPPENIYYRVYKRGNEYAVFLLYEWAHQVMPPHRHDYEPVIVFLDKDLNIKEVYVDGFHYYIQKYKAPPLTDVKPHLRISTPWRAMEVSWSEPSKNYIMVYPVDEVKGTFSKSRIRYLSDKVVHELRSRNENPLSVHQRLIKNPWSVKEAKHWATFSEPTPNDLLNDFAKNYGIGKVDVFLEKAKLFIKSLAESVKVMLSSIGRKMRNRVLGERDEYEILES